MVFEKGLLTAVCAGRKEVTGNGEDFIVRSFMVGTANVVMCII